MSGAASEARLDCRRPAGGAQHCDVAACSCADWVKFRERLEAIVTEELSGWASKMTRQESTNLATLMTTVVDCLTATAAPPDCHLASLQLENPHHPKEEQNTSESCGACPQGLSPCTGGPSPVLSLQSELDPEKVAHRGLEGSTSLKSWGEVGETAASGWGWITESIMAFDRKEEAQGKPSLMRWFESMKLSLCEEKQRLDELMKQKAILLKEIEVLQHELGRGHPKGDCEEATEGPEIPTGSGGWSSDRTPEGQSIPVLSAQTNEHIALIPHVEGHAGLPGAYQLEEDDHDDPQRQQRQQRQQGLRLHRQHEDQLQQLNPSRDLEKDLEIVEDSTGLCVRNTFVEFNPYSSHRRVRSLRRVQSCGALQIVAPTLPSSPPVRTRSAEAESESVRS